MSNLAKLFDYRGTKVIFRNENGVAFINATQMAKPFGKSPKDYLKTQQANELIQAVSDRINVLTGDVVKVKKGGVDQGTWMHETVALDFAQWLSVDLRLWCNDRIKELLTTGSTSIAQPKTEDALLLEAMTILNNRVAQKEAELQEAKQIIEVQAPKVEYVNKVLASESCFLTNTIAKELGMSAVSLNKFLKAKSVQYSQDKHWVLYAKYQNLGFAKTRTHTYTDSDGRPRTNIQTVWTEKGRQFIHKLYRDQFDNPGTQLRLAN